MKIPKNLIFTYSEKSKLPDILQENVQNIKQENPQWNFYLFDEEGQKEFILKHYGLFHLNLYNSISYKFPPAKSDFFRYLFIYEKGGLYLDVKAGVLNDLNAITKLPQKFSTSNWENEYSSWGKQPELAHFQAYQQWFLLSPPKSPVLERIITRVSLNILFYNQAIFFGGKKGVLRVTGPIPFTQEIRKSSPALTNIISAYDIGLRYSILDQLAPGKHRQVFPNHYSMKQGPVVDNRKISKIKHEYQEQITSIIKKYKSAQKKYNLQNKIENLQNYSLPQILEVWFKNPFNTVILEKLLLKSKEQKNNKVLKFAFRTLNMLEPYRKG